MGYLYTDGNLQIPYPDGAEDFDVPGDLGLLAQTVDDAVTEQINSNVVLSASSELTETPPNPNVEVVDSHMTIYLTPPDLAGKLDSAGGTITGNLQIDGDLTFGGSGTVTVPTPTLPSHAATKEYADKSAFVGEMRMFLGTAVDDALAAGWYICDGTAHGNSTLATKIGANTPDFRGRLPIGESASYTRGSSYGASSVTLTTTHLPVHNHTINTSSASHTHTVTVNTGGGSKTPAGSIGTKDTNHTHSGSTGNPSSNHTHGSPYNFALTDGVPVNPGGTNSYAAITGWVDQTDGVSAWHYHSFTSGYCNSNASHNHTFSGSSLNIDHSHTASSGSSSTSHNHTSVNAGSGNAFSIIPPTIAVAFMVFGG